MVRIVVASGNEGKINDFRAIFPDDEIIGIKEMLPGFSVDETEDTFRGNAILKAEAAAEALDMPVLSDDSGLSVDALDGAPGVHSARFAGVDATDEENNSRLLSELEGVGDRTAHFTCVIALAMPGRETRTYEGKLQGEILESPQGGGGFGYDPLFRTEDGRLLGMVSAEEKGEISHRRNALDRLREDTELFDALIHFDGDDGNEDSDRK
ncbi:RdgB/HAM1 family non-canonical purine NTP pyrophosphatase [Salinicoccus roseus]|uniref:RdgB/HAM1 family non-canonical purine NTP pyrophosphatase n=1 Tax=Salinicoccus roseus TaxID=45670 RepID=UPI000F4FC9C6|nr:RdgB/HAM1 family non-canonical purine NTP pyrophosphatase [Salinicoccus roseus]RPE53988.1 XTP/dITP diphosphohydrolase [Salinicoccus roseus]GGA69259.1 non-canonical purine NTP pyrophosphatase [Salinicoccus roseus]